MIPLPKVEIEDLERQIEAGQLVEDPVVDVACGEVASVVYDATVDEDASFVADGLVVHNSEICRFLDGKTFSVGDALGRFDRIEQMESPEDIKAEQPWVREAIDPETGRKILYVDRGGVRTPIAEVVRSGLGASDDRGEFARGRSERELMDLGVSFPPLHGLCRSSLLPVV